jgi:hypothetical protein
MAWARASFAALCFRLNFRYEIRMRIPTAAVVVCGAMALGLVGCGGDDTTAQAPATQPVAVSSPGGAPTFGQPSGTGFSTGDSIHSTGQGSGAMGYNNTGATGTSNSITDTHPVEVAPKNDANKPPVLQAP